MKEFKKHPNNKKLPDPPENRKEYSGWAYVGQGDPDTDIDDEKWKPLRDTIGKKVCPLMSVPHRGGGDVQRECIHQKCAFYTEVHEREYEFDEYGRQVMEVQSDGKKIPKIKEDCVTGYCSEALTPVQLYTVGMMLKRIANLSDFMMADIAKKQMVKGNG